MKYTLALLCCLLAPPVSAQPAPPMAGVWTLNRSLSEFRNDIGFNVNWAQDPVDRGGQSGGASGGGSGGRGRRGSSGGGSTPAAADPFSARGESYEGARRVQILTGEVRNPPARLIVIDAPSAFTITNELGQSRTFHPEGLQESIDVQGVIVPTTTKREGDRLVVQYHVEKDRELRYTFSHADAPSQLIVAVEFLEHGTVSDKARRVYEPAAETRTPATPGGGASPETPVPGRPPSAAAGAPEPFDQRPGAELRGLTSLGILVENLSPQSIACGLNQRALESALTKRLTDGGFTVRQNSDEDTYVYVNVETSRQAEGICVTRYDAFLYTQGTAKLSYHDQPVLVQVSLIHRGGIGTSAPVSHAAAVERGLQDYIDLFITQIHAANK